MVISEDNSKAHLIGAINIVLVTYTTVRFMCQPFLHKNDSLIYLSFHNNVVDAIAIGI